MTGSEKTQAGKTTVEFVLCDAVNIASTPVVSTENMPATEDTFVAVWVHRLANLAAGMLSSTRHGSYSFGLDRGNIRPFRHAHGDVFGMIDELLTAKELRVEIGIMRADQ